MSKKPPASLDLQKGIGKKNDALGKADKYLSEWEELLILAGDTKISSLLDLIESTNAVEYVVSHSKAPPGRNK